MSALRALCGKTRRQAFNLRRIARAQSRFKLLFTAAFALAFEAGLWLLFRDGFRFLDALGGAGLLLIDRLFTLFFLGMGMMLAVSGVVAAYTAFFRSGEVPFLLSQPFTIATVVGYKSVEAAAYSSWAFVFIVVPFAGAYASHRGFSALFALWTFLFSVPFLAVCSQAGALLVLALVRWLPRGKAVKALWLLLTAGLAAAVPWMARLDPVDSQFGAFNLSRLVPGLRLASNPLLPSNWVGDGILALARGDWFRGGMLWGVLASTAAVGALAVDALGRLVFYEAWQRAAYAPRAARRQALLFGRFARLCGPLSADVRAMLLKDLRTFVRDPAQWSQALIFFGLLALYFTNLRTLRYHVLPDAWRNMIAFLNVFSASAVMCSLGARFVYPQLSLEGQGFWLLGLAPTTAGRVLLTKFLAALAPTLLASVSLMLVSTGMLRSTPEMQSVAVVLAAGMACAVSGLSTGLGGVFIDLAQDNPAAIVSGFGGTLNLALSLGYMLAGILPFGIAFHFHTVGVLDAAGFGHAVAACIGWLTLLTILTTVLPLWLGRRALERLEL